MKILMIGLSVVRESQFQNKIIKIINDKYGIALKYQESGTTKVGIPDIIAGINGKIIFIECKTDSGVLSKIQEKQIDRLKKNITPYVYVVKPSTYDDLIKELNRIKEDNHENN